MADNQKSPYRQALETLQRVQRRADGMKQQGEKLAGEALRTVVGGTAAFAGGFVDERYGTADAHGIRTHKVNGAPSVMVAGMAAKAAAAFGVFGKYDDVGFSAGQGGIDHSLSTFGRRAGAVQRVKAERGAQKDEATNGKKTAEAKTANG